MLNLDIKLQHFQTFSVYPATSYNTYLMHSESPMCINPYKQIHDPLAPLKHAIQPLEVGNLNNTALHQRLGRH